MDLRESFYLSPARTVFRRVQGVQLLARLRPSGTPATPPTDLPTDGGDVRVHAGGVEATMVAEDAVEHARLMTFHEEAPLIEAIFSLLGPGDTYWDIGASLGLYSLLAAERVGPTGRVVAFEPEPGSRARLTANIARNGFEDRITVCEVALGAERAELALTVQGHAASGFHTLVQATAGPDTEVHTELVAVVPGDDLRAERTLPVPTVAKIDVEGAELDVARGLTRTLQEPGVRGILIEMHFGILDEAGRGGDSRRLIHLLDALGFTTRTWIDKSHVLCAR